MGKNFHEMARYRFTKEITKEENNYINIRKFITLNTHKMYELT